MSIPSIPSSGSGSTPPPSSSDLPPQVQIPQTYSPQGESAIKDWFSFYFPGMSDADATKAANQFTMQVMQTIQESLNQSMKNAKEAAKQLKESIDE
ncbi:MAG: hypothetical protein HYZ47_03925 [Simkania negevensis]|nr:hypothetical protein [Simkania negevensis]